MRTLRALVITDVVKKEIQEIVNHASKPEHWYDPADKSEGWIGRLPGNSEKHIYSIFDGYRCVFSYTRAHDRDGKSIVVRHLSVSVDGDGFPSPEAVFEICKMFGFTGERDADLDRMFPADWFIEIKKGDGCLDTVQCIVVGQKVQA